LRSITHSARYTPIALLERLRTRNPFVRMPPLGVSEIDTEGAALVERWIRQDLLQQPERSP
jgi:hypothetical protein